MGRQHHHMKLPDHLYLSPPQTPTTRSSKETNNNAPSFLSLKSATYSSAALISETSSSAALAVGESIPGFKTSAAFLQTLRANLALFNPPNTPSAYPSDLSTPPSSSTSTPDSLHPVNMASSTGSLPPLTPSPLSQPPTTSSPTDLDTPRELSTQPAQTDALKIPCLQLIADSVAQQRQTAATTIIFHPLTLSLLVAVFAGVLQLLYHGSNSDIALVATSMIGIVMGGLVGIRGLTAKYLDEAERVGTWKWLDAGRKEADSAAMLVGKEDDILYTTYGDEVIGAIVIRGVSTAAPSSGKSHKSPSLAQTQGVIRAWTVKRRTRGKGVGTALLEDAVKLCRERGWGAGVVFADDHANHVRLGYFWGWFDGPVERRERRAREALVSVVESMEAEGVKVAEKEKADGGGAGRRKKR